MREALKLILTGIGIGAANVVPGVSGGTVALIAGVFERLVNSIKNFDLIALKLFFKGDFKELFCKLDLRFLILIFIGIGFGVISLAQILEFLFIEYPVFIWSYFFGLILASVFFIIKNITKLSLSTTLCIILGLVIAVFIAIATPVSPNPAIYYLVLCGVVAACSMILPGLSGSFMLILMGNYTLILNAVNERNINIIFPVLVGAILGLIIFTKLLSWVIKRYHNQTLGCLTGFVAGSLLTLWPWKIQTEVGYRWLIPSSITVEVIVAFVLIILGVVSLYLAERTALKY